MKIREELVAKYNKPVPRYTSYPPANYFHEELSHEAYCQLLTDSNQANPKNISIYIHIPFCNKLCHFCGCNAQIKQGEEVIKEYVEALKTELEMLSAKLNPNRKLSQIHYGGGTPNAIDAHYLIELNALILSKFQTIEEPEIAIECNPAYLTEAYIQDLHKAGFNRFSIGIQDFGEDVLKIVNREPSKLPLSDLLPLLRANGALINLDFIYGLPGQTIASFGANMEKAIALHPDRLVTFSYAHVPWVKKAQKALERVGLPSSNDKIKMFETAYNSLTQSGYESIGLDHYARKEDELTKALHARKLHRNFQGYCTKKTTGQVYAIGISGISQMQHSYAQNTKDIKEYVYSIQQGKFCIKKHYQLTTNEQLIRESINGLMCNNFLEFSVLAEKFKLSQQQVMQTLKFHPDKLADFLQDQLAEFDGNTLQVTAQGMLYIRNIASSLDPLMETASQNFSKSV